MVLLVVDTQKGIVDERLYAFEKFVSNIRERSEEHTSELQSRSSIGRSPRRCCNTNRTIEKPRGVKSYAAGVFFIAAVKQKMKMKEIYLSKPPVDCCGDGEP